MTPALLEQGCRLEELHEGLKLAPYRCTAGFLTVGCGYNMDARGTGPLERVIGRPFDGRLTAAEARAVLRGDILALHADLSRALPWFATLDGVRQLALIDMAMMGLSKLLKFHTTLPAIARGDWATAAAGIRASKWARDVGARRMGHVVGMIETGIFPL